MELSSLMSGSLTVAARQGVIFDGAPAPPAQANPTPGCSVTPAQLEANKKTAMSFFNPATDKIALADPSYKQHNPAFVKRAADAHISDIEEYRNAFSGRGGGRGRGPQGDGPRPPQGNPFEIVTAECDIVTMIHKNYRQDPTAEAGKFYEVFTFDTFRVKDGKLVEHWDGAVINPNAPDLGGRQ